MDICETDGYTQIDELAKNILNMRKYFDNLNELQKAVMGAILNDKKYGMKQSVLVNVTNKIAKRLLDLRLDETTKSEIIKQEIENYILYFTSDDKERQQMQQVLEDFMAEVYEE